MEGLIVFISTESMRWRESFREQVFLMDAFALEVAVGLQAIITILLNQTRVVAGVNGEQFFYVLSSGESVTLPEVVLTYSSHGFEEMTHHYHDAIRNHLLRGEYVHKHRPILINNWEATYFDFTGEKIFDIAKKASSLGIEMLVAGLVKEMMTVVALAIGTSMRKNWVAH